MLNPLFLPGSMRRGASFLLVPGLVPDGPETFARQRRLFERFGSAVALTYPYEAFSLDSVVDGLRRFVWDARAKGRSPILVGVSVGGGFCLELLKRERQRGSELPLAGLILISPLICAEDLSPLLKRLLSPILAASSSRSPQAGERALERGRDFFRSLAVRSVPHPASSRRSQRWLNKLILTLRLEPDEAELRARILRTLERIPAAGALDRCMALAQLAGLDRSDGTLLSSAPTLILWGSKERHTLDLDGPGVALLCRPDLAVRHFSRVEVHWLYDQSGGAVPHASLLLHHNAFNKALSCFLRRHARELCAAKTTESVESRVTQTRGGFRASTWPASHADEEQRCSLAELMTVTECRSTNSAAR